MWNLLKAELLKLRRCQIVFGVIVVEAVVFLALIALVYRRQEI